jgi:hypothetical protein
LTCHKGATPPPQNIRESLPRAHAHEPYAGIGVIKIGTTRRLPPADQALREIGWSRVSGHRMTDDFCVNRIESFGVGAYKPFP